MSSEKIIVLYERLSREDENLGESYSISNQKKLLEDYCREKGWTRFRHFTDDGISGTTFDRPSFKAMIQLVEDGEVETIILKDMSRLGRDYLVVGQLREFFRKKGVRLIAINDNHDSYSFAGSSQERQFNFTEIERAYYYEHYSDFVDAQNERNEQARHPERNRTIDDVLKNNKTCPEESVIQLGNIDHAVTPDVLAKVSAEFFDEFNKRYGSHIHILDWALHLDEATPHIHERHVFDAKNKYGELCPQQDKALEELGFELPDPAKKKGKYNNRKMNFDAECRKLFLEIAQRNGVQVECEPVYGGAGYLEKQDFIIENQKKRIAEKQAVLDEITMRVLDMENFVEQVAEDAYEKACEAVSDTMAEQTRAEDIEELRRYKKWLTSDERKTPKDKRDFVGRCLDNLENRLRGMAQKVAGKVMETLQNPRIKEQKKSEVKEHARKSVRALLEANRKLVEEQRAKVAETPAHKKARGEELG